MKKSHRIKLALRKKPSKSDLHQVNDNMKIIKQRRRRKTVPKVSSRGLVSNNNVIFLTGGIGDVITLEAHMSHACRESITTILYATHKYSYIKELFEALSNFPKLKTHRVVWNDFTKFWCFLSKQDCINRLGNKADEELKHAEDWGIVQKFPLINSGVLTYNKSSFITNTLCEIKQFHLPQNYMVIQPCSTDKRDGRRDFTNSDWSATLYWLKNKNMKGVVINKGNELVLDSPNLINLTNKTTLCECIEILKNANGYIGVDSWLSPLAAKLFNAPNLAIKSVSGHCYDNKHIYFTPQQKFDFLSNDLIKILKL